MKTHSKNRRVKVEQFNSEHGTGTVFYHCIIRFNILLHQTTWFLPCRSCKLSLQFNEITFLQSHLTIFIYCTVLSSCCTQNAQVSKLLHRNCTVQFLLHRKCTGFQVAAQKLHSLVPAAQKVHRIELCNNCATSRTFLHSLSCTAFLCSTSTAPVRHMSCTGAAQFHFHKFAHKLLRHDQCRLHQTPQSHTTTE